MCALKLHFFLICNKKLEPKIRHKLVGALHKLEVKMKIDMCCSIYKSFID